MNIDFYNKRTKKLLSSGYPLALNTIDLTISDTPIYHHHDEIELIYISKGHAHIAADDINITASTGDIIFINQSVIHCITPAKNDGGVIHSIIVHPSFIIDAGQLALEQKYITPVISDGTFDILHITPSNDLYNSFENYLNNLISLNISQSSCYELLSKAYILQIWHLIYQNRPVSTCIDSGVTARIANQDSNRIKLAIRYIEAHFMEQVTLDDISGSILVSKSECCRCFKRALGISPVEYLMKYRISQSVKRMHEKTHDSISEIAGSVGFNNTSYYNKVFKRFMGCTPTEYRHDLRK